MATFNGFPKLPGEIRNMIWSFVIRDDRPGVQIFRSKNCAGASRSEDAGTTFSKLSKPLPSFPSVKEGDRSRKNVLTYLIDAGLWMACKESRAIMESHFRIPKWTIRQYSKYEVGNCLVGLTRCEWSTGALPPRASPVDRLWIIDHGLKRTKGAPTIEEMSTGYKYRVFYASDRKLVEANGGNARHFTAYYLEAFDKEGQSLRDCSVDLAWRLYDTYGRPVSVLIWDDLEG